MTSAIAACQLSDHGKTIMPRWPTFRRCVLFEPGVLSGTVLKAIAPTVETTRVTGRSGPAAIRPAAQDVIADERAQVGPGVTNPSVPNPRVPNPRVPNPRVPNPRVPNPRVPNPRVPNPSVPNPSVPNPSVPNPSVPNPSVPNPSVPRLSVPSLSVPSLSVPSLSVPSLSVPSLSMTDWLAAERRRARESVISEAIGASWAGGAGTGFAGTGGAATGPSGIGDGSLGADALETAGSGAGAPAGPAAPVVARPPRRRRLYVTRLWALVKVGSMAYTTAWAMSFAHAGAGAEISAYGAVCLFAGFGARWRKRFFGAGQIIEPELYEELGRYLYRAGVALVLVGGAVLTAQSSLR